MNVPRKRRLPRKPIIRNRWPVGEHGPELFMPAKGTIIVRPSVDIDLCSANVVEALRKYYREGGAR